VPERVAVGRQRRHDIDVPQRERKLRRQHAHDGERFTVDSNASTDEVGGAAVPLLPQPITQDDDERRVGPIVGRVQETPRGGGDAEDVKRIRRHSRTLKPLGDACTREAGAPIGVRREARQRARPTAVVDELGKRERCIRRVSTDGFDPHEPLWRCER
jgi:hypothetical protein